METSGGGIMNERIRELAKEAGWPDSLVAPVIMDKLNEFAELIVQECSRMADGWVDNDDNGKNYPSEMIKQYFGIKE
jgi:hypothetical protein